MFLHGNKTTPNASMEQALEARLVAAAQQAAANGDDSAQGAIKSFRAAAPLPDDANRLFDQAVVRVGRNRLRVANEVISRGLTYSLPNWLSVPELYWEKLSDSGNVNVAMDPSTRFDSSLEDRSGVTMPIPAIVATFQLGARTLLASQRSGQPLDTSLMEQHTRRVNEQIEDIFINGWAGTVGGNQIYGLANAPNKNTITYTGSNKAWDHASKTGAEILTDVLAHAAALEAKNMFGPYTLFIPTEYQNALNDQYSTSFGPLSIRAVLEDLTFGGEKLKIVVADQITDDYTYMVQMTSDVIQAVVGQTPTQVSWGDGPGWNQFYAVLACILPRIRDDYASQSGISVGYTS